MRGLGLALCLAGGIGSAAAAEPASCRVWIERVDAEGVASLRAECRWDVAAEHVGAIVRDPARLGAALSTLRECRALPDGRVLQVHGVGWPIQDRQVTLDWRTAALDGGGWRFEFARAARQEPLATGRVQIEVDEGWWEIRPGAQGGTRLAYAVRYDAGGSLEPWLVRRFQSEGVARSLDELRRAAEAGSRTGVGLASGGR